MTPSEQEKENFDNLIFQRGNETKKENFVLWILMCNAIDYIWGWGCKTPDDFYERF